MDLSKHFPKDLYPSYIVEGEPEVLTYEIVKFLENRGDIKMEGSDMLCEVYDSFSIDDSRVIKDWNSNKRVSDDKKICIIAAKFLNREAGQSLLKILEELQEKTHFFIILPNISSIASTIISRSHVVRLEESINLEREKIINKFIKSTIKERFDIVAEIIKTNKKEEESSVLRHYVSSFINDLEKVFYEKFKNNKSDMNILQVLEEIQKSRKYLNSQGSSIKMILENLAIVI